MIKKEVDKSKKRANMTFLFLMFPSLILAILPSEINGNAFYGLFMKIIILGYQYFVVKNFVESKYEE